MRGIYLAVVAAMKAEMIVPTKSGGRRDLGETSGGRSPDKMMRLGITLGILPQVIHSKVTDF
jgi:hypothetical protein